MKYLGCPIERRGSSASASPDRAPAGGRRDPERIGAVYKRLILDGERYHAARLRGKEKGMPRHRFRRRRAAPNFISRAPSHGLIYARNFRIPWRPLRPWRHTAKVAFSFFTSLSRNFLQSVVFDAAQSVFR
ncbi:hypothetical protein K8I61_07260 [bacterium]|nr:hypothetical protein [bacterium]